jgi:hypothetical protein
MQRDELLRYGTRVPLALILDHPRFAALSKLGLELRRAAARTLNEALAEKELTRVRFARLSGIDYAALTLVCTARRAMDVALLKRALARLGRDWRAAMAPFEEAYDHRGRGSALRRGMNLANRVEV